MKIQQPSPDELQVATSATSGVTVGMIFLLLGIGAFVASFIVDFNGSKLLPMAGGIIFFVVGLTVLLTASSETVVLRKGGQSSVQKKRAIGGGSKAQAFDTAAVVSVRLVTTRNTAFNPSANQPNQANQRRSILSLILNDNSEVTLGSSQGGSGLSVNGVSVGGLVQKAPLADEAQQIAAFLGVPLDAADQTNLITGIRSVADAVMNRGEPEAAQPTATPPVVPGAVQAPTTVQPTAPVPPAPAEPDPTPTQPQQ